MCAIKARKNSPLNKLSADQRIQLLRDFYSSGGTPPLREQSFRADLMAYLLGEESLPIKTIRRHLGRRIKKSAKADDHLT